MQMLYNSDSFAVVLFDVAAAVAPQAVLAPADAAVGAGAPEPLSHGGYEIVDKFARKEIYLEGALAQHFREGVAELARNDPTPEQVEEFIAGYTGLPQQPLVLH